MADKQTWNERYAAKELVWSAGPNRLFAEVVSEFEPGRALDLGCGEGRNALYLAEHGWRVTGIDYAEEGISKALALARHRNVNVNFRVDDAATVVLAPASFDLVAVIYLHTGPQERGNWLPEAVRAVAPGGHFLYVGHDPSNITDGVGGPRDPSVLPGVDTLCEALAGFDIERAEVYRRSLDADPGHGGSDTGIALDTLVVARRESGP